MLCSFITMWVSSSPSVSFFRYFGFPCVYLFFAVVGLRRRNRFQFKVIMTPEQLSMNCNCHLATYRCFVCCSFIFYCCVVIFIQWYYSNENLFCYCIMAINRIQICREVFNFQNHGFKIFYLHVQCDPVFILK